MFDNYEQRFDHTMDNRVIFAGDGMNLQLLCNGIVGLIIFADDQDSGGIHVNAVYNAWPHDAVDAGKLIFAVMHQAIYQCAGVMPGRR